MEILPSQPNTLSVCRPNKHVETSDLFCWDCEEFLCAKCWDRHKAHSLEDSEDLKTTLGPELMPELKEMKDKLTQNYASQKLQNCVRIKEIEEKVTEYVEKWKSAYDQACKEIEAQADKLTSIVISQGIYTQQSLDALQDQVNARIRETEKEVRLAEEHLNVLTKCESHVEVLSVPAPRSPVPLQPVQVPLGLRWACNTLS